MTTNEVTHIFTPFWLMNLPSDERDDVRQWLKDAGVNINLCPGFDYDGHLITTRYYQVNEMGQAMVDDEQDPIYEDQVREFPAETAPVAVHTMMRNIRA